MKRPILVLTCIITIILGLSIAQASMANQISTTGADLVAVQEQVKDYKKNNTILNEQVLEASSFTNLQKKAKKLGFVEAKTPEYMNAPLPLAKR
jgi:cell division protein FtsL